jgi:hypothetical protein
MTHFRVTHTVVLAGLQPAVANATSHLCNQCNLWITLSATWGLGNLLTW